MSLDIFAYLKRSELCKGCSDQEIMELKTNVELIELPEGHTLFQKGDFADALYVICSGNIEIRVPHDAQVEVIAKLAENAILGEVGILTDQVRSASAIAVTPVTLLKMTRAALERLLSDGKLVAYKLVYQIAKILSFRLRQMDQAIAKMMNRTSPPHEINQLRAKLQADWPF
jgi:CRP-like cAMP-binding protein